MRRHEREIGERARIDDLIRGATVCRLGLVDQGEAYVVPLSFGYDGQALYFHSAREGRKVELLKRHPRAAFELDLMEGLIERGQACEWGMRYQSVMGTGTVEFLEEAEAKRHGLAVIMAHYGNGPFRFAEAALARTLVFRLVIERVSGKQSAG